MRGFGPEGGANSDECTVGRGKSGLDGVGSLLDDLGNLLGSNFFSRKSRFSEHGVAKTQLNSTIHASKMGQKWVNSVEFGRKKWRG